MPAHAAADGPRILYVFFHGPWGFAVDDQAQTITALTPACNGHQYCLGDGPVLQSMLSGNYALVDPGAVAGLPHWISQIPQQTSIAAMPSRFTLPQPQDDPRVHSTFVWPLTSLLGYPCHPRSMANNDGDNLLSGRHFSLLNQTTATQPAHLGLAQILPFQIRDLSRLRIVSDSGCQWLPLAGSEGAIKLHIHAQSIVPTAEDHFSMMAGLFNLDLHLDGCDVNQSLLVQADPSVCCAKDQPPITADDLKSLEERQAPASSRSNLFTVKFPIACGGNIVIYYNPQAMLAPPAPAPAGTLARMPGMGKM